MRDYGPLSIEADGHLGFVDLRYYPGRLYDDNTGSPRAEVGREQFPDAI